MAGALKRMATAEGEALPMGEKGFAYQYFLKDHLGNVRAVIRDDDTGSPEVIQAKTYYPFGMVFTSEMMQGTIADKTNSYLFNGKEQQEMPGLWYDYGARMYDAQLGRWHVVDPEADQRVELTPFNYARNNPISRIDPDGKLDDWYKSASGALIWQDENKKQININGENYKNVGTSASVQTIDGSYVNYYQNLAISTSNAPVNAEQTVLSNPGVKAELLGKDSPLSVKSQTGLFQASIHQGQNDFLNHPVTKATANGLLFVATGGVEGVMSLASGAKSTFSIIKNSKPSDWIRSGKTIVSNQIVKGSGTPGATVTWGVKGGGNLTKTGENMGFHFHIHKYNWYKPSSWFKQTPIIKPPKP